MFFSSTPPAPGGDQSVNLAIPPAPDRDLQTRTMSLSPDAPAVAATTSGVVPAAGAPSDQLATVNIGYSRPRDVEIEDRKSVGEGKSVSVRVNLGGRRILKKKKQY